MKIIKKCLAHETPGILKKLINRADLNATIKLCHHLVIEGYRLNCHQSNNQNISESLRQEEIKYAEIYHKLLDQLGGLYHE